MSDLAEAARREVLELHAAFVELFTGRASDFARCAAAFANDFEMVTPSGARLARRDILAGIEAARVAPGFRIEILEIRAVWEHHNSVLLQYVEQQYRDGRMTRRRSTALFEALAEAPCGVVWRYLHETWMQNAEN
jgi:hypothetical protein